MVTLYNRDGEIYDLPYRILEIIKEYRETGTVEISTNSEGLCLSHVGFYKILDELIVIAGIPSEKITIYTNNTEESHHRYNIIVKPNHWANFAKQQDLSNFNFEKHISYHVGLFLGKPNWHRWIISSWINRNYSNKTLQTYHFYPEEEQYKKQSQLTELYVETDNNTVIEAMDLVNKLPLKISNEKYGYTIGYEDHYKILSEYPKIFLDLVVETYVMGKTFFPTEKTFRPILAETPFVIMGPAGFLSNMKRVGFKTFNEFWDESYDDYSGVDRINKIKTVMDKIYSFSLSDLYSLNKDIQGIVKYNKQHLYSITGDSFLL